MKITLAQVNPVVGNITGNVHKIIETYLDAEEQNADLVVFPELAVTGYPIDDLAHNPDVLDAAKAGLDALCAATKGRNAVLVVGAPVRAETRGEGWIVARNSAFLFENGEVVGEVVKQNLPHHGIFNEVRNFIPGTQTMKPVVVKGKKLGVLVGEDIWFANAAADLKRSGADILIIISASPFQERIMEMRVQDAAAMRVAETGLPLVFVNQVGGQDELVFDGGSFFMDARGKRVRQAPQWEECVVDFHADDEADGRLVRVYPDPLEEIWRAMVAGLGEYARKSGFTDVVLGLSGGMDSALAAAVAGDALGAERVHCVRLPSGFTSDLSNNTAGEMCRIWNFDMMTVAISPVVGSVGEALAPVRKGGKELQKLTMENMQARVRGLLLMTLSNEYNWLLLSTGNKSEIAVGYATLYGDMCGGYNPLKDVYKTTVFELARWRNANRPAGLLGPEGVVIPEEIITRPPSAELSEGQLDTDSLPPYEVLDGILRLMVDGRMAIGEIVGKGYEEGVVKRVYRMLTRSEYKRRQGAPGPKTSVCSFSGDRRVPMVNGFDVSQVAELREMGGLER